MNRAVSNLILAALLGLAVLSCGPATPTEQATPVTAPGPGGQEALLAAARQDLAERLGLDLGDVTVEGVSPTQFRDSCLEIPPAGALCAQVITPGYLITLSAAGQSYRYHAGGSRVVYAGEAAGPQGSLTIEQVEVAAGGQVTVRGVATLPDGSCLNSELWADGVQQAWWPGADCVTVEGGAWQMVVPLGQGDAPAALDPAAEYIIRAFLRDGPDIVAVFPFDLAGPPAAAP